MVSVGKKSELGIWIPFPFISHCSFHSHSFPFPCCCHSLHLFIYNCYSHSFHLFQFIASLYIFQFISSFSFHLFLFPVSSLPFLSQSPASFFPFPSLFLSFFPSCSSFQSLYFFLSQFLSLLFHSPVSFPLYFSFPVSFPFLSSKIADFQSPSHFSPWKSTMGGVGSHRSVSLTVPTIFINSATHSTGRLSCR